VWSATVGFLHGGYLPLVVCAALNTKHLKFDSFGSFANSFFTLQCFFFTIMVPLYVFVEYWRYMRAHEDDESSVSGYDGDSESEERGEETLKRYKDEFVGTYLAYYGLKLEMLWFSGVILARKLIIGLTCVYLQDFENFSLFIFVFCSITMIIATGQLRPY